MIAVETSARIWSSRGDRHPDLFSGNLPDGSVSGFAQFASDEYGATHRIYLTRWWGDTGPRVAFVGINPSDASGTKDDPTIRRCVSFAQREGYGGFYMLNLFSIVDDDPRVLRTCLNKSHTGHLAARFTMLREAAAVVLCWGNPGHAFAVARKILRDQLHELPAHVPILCFGLTKTGQPRHPLYLRGDQPLVPYRQEAA